MRWTYQQTGTESDSWGEMWTVGDHDATGAWRAESDWATESEARDRANLLNTRGVEAAELALIRPGHPVPDCLVS